MNLETLNWDEKLCSFYGVPVSVLPKIRSCSEVYGTLNVSSLVGVPISGCIGDQQGALVGQNCWRPGQAVTTLGSSSCTMYNAGPRIVDSEAGLVSTVAYQLGPSKPPVYAIEGSSLTAGSAVDWLRSNLGVIKNNSDIEASAAAACHRSDQVSTEYINDLHFVPALNGHQCPRWMPEARGLILGINQHTTKSHLCRAVLDAVAFTTREVLDTMQTDTQIQLSTLLVDGGMSSNNLLLQILADNIGIPVLRPSMPETSALGAAIMAGCAKGVDVWDVRASIHTTMDKFMPRLTPDERDLRYELWQQAVDLSVFWAKRATHSNTSSSNTSSFDKLTQVRSLPSPPRWHSPSTDRDRRLRASVPFTIFAFASFLVWKIASARAHTT